MTLTAAFNTLMYTSASSSAASGITVANIGYKCIKWRLFAGYFMETQCSNFFPPFFM